MTNILIPTDFTAASIKMAEQALEAANVKSVNIVFFHLFDSPSSEFELLDPSRKKPYSNVFTDSFRQQCKQLKDQYNTVIQKVCFKFLEGTGVGLFRNFMEANEIDLIYCPDSYKYVAINNKSADPRYLFKKSGVVIMKETSAKKRSVLVEEPQMVAPTGIAIPAIG